MNKIYGIFNDPEWQRQEAWERERSKEKQIWLEEKGLAERSLKDVVADIIGVKTEDFRANAPKSFKEQVSQLKAACKGSDGSWSDFHIKLEAIQKGETK